MLNFSVFLSVARGGGFSFRGHFNEQYIRINGAGKERGIF